MIKEKEITYLDSFVASTSMIPEIIERLFQDLTKMEYTKLEIDEIIISMDESITNAVQATIKNPNKFSKNLYITIRYSVSETEFEATIIDHGTGFDLIETLNSTPDRKSSDYHNQVMNYSIDTGKSQASLKVNNKHIFLKGVGAGLKIILNFMDSVSIEYIDKKTMVAPSVSESTDGTIFNMKRKRRIPHEQTSQSI